MDCRYLTLIFSVLVLSASAQLRVPSFEVAVKAGYVNIGDDRNDPSGGNSIFRTYESIYAQGELSVHIGQHIAIGYFHQRSILGDYHDSGGNSGQDVNLEGEHLIHGLNLRLSTGRTSKFRAYVQFKYFESQFLIDYGDFRVAREGPGAGAGVGLMLRLGHKLYLNLIEAEATTLLSESDVLFSDDKILFPTVRTGITYNFSKRK